MADKSKNTGTGGINIDGKIYTPDVGVPDGQGGSQGNYSSGDIAVDKTVKDLSKPTKETFAKYLSNSTLAKIGDSLRPNAYPVGSGDQTTIRPASLKDEKGFPSRPALAANEKIFSTEFSFQMGAPAPLPLKKGIAPNEGQDGNTLLPDAALKSSGNFLENALGGVGGAIGVNIEVNVPSIIGDAFFGEGVKFTTLNEPIKSYTENLLDKNLYDGGIDTAVPSFRFSDAPLVGFYGPFALRKPIKILDDGTFSNLANDPIIRTITNDTAVAKAMDEVAGKNYVPGGLPNKYAPKSGTFEFDKDISIAGSDGYPLSPTNAQEGGNEYGFAKKIPTTYTDDLASSQLKENLRRGKAPGAGPDGHVLLRRSNDGDLKEDNKPNVLVDDYVNVVLKHNRFTPLKGEQNSFFAKDYLERTAKDPWAFDDSEIRDFYKETAAFPAPRDLTFGKSPGNDDRLKRQYTFGKLAKIAPTLQQRATLINPLEESGATADAISSPIFDIESFRKPQQELSVSQILVDLLEDDVLSGEDDNLTEDNPNIKLLSFGTTFETVLNNVYDQFSGLSNETQIATATALILAIFKAMEVIDAFDMAEEEVWNASTGTKDKPFVRRGIGSYRGGKLTPSIYDFIKATRGENKTYADQKTILGLVCTKKPYKQAVLIGIVTFFGIKRFGNYAKFERSTKDISYALTLARAIIRASARLGILLSELSNRDEDKRTRNRYLNEYAYEVFKIKRESRLIGIFNFFAQVGDIGTTSKVAENGEKIIFDESLGAWTFQPDPTRATELTNAEANATDVDDAGRRISLLDDNAKNLDVTTRVVKYGKSRLLQDAELRKLAWSIDQTPDMLVGIKDFTKKLSINLGGPQYKISANLDPTTTIRTQFIKLPEESSRFSPLVVANIESKFDSEYMPFYFHDVRTNELIGFHAFILSLTDDYSAAYESVDGFGRIEPVKIYKNTQRKIAISFLVAALDEHDYDIMWSKINKLTTLVYPQYTQGRRITVDNPDPRGEYDFVKPFTQAIAAAPLTRLRLGNLIKSNYSKFNLAKIFGLHYKDTLIEGIDRDGTIALQRATTRRDQKIAAADRKKKIAEGKAKTAEQAAKSQRTNIYDPKYDWHIRHNSKGNLYAVQKGETPRADSPDPKAKKAEQKPVEDKAKQKDKTQGWLFADEKNRAKFVCGDAWTKYGLVANVEAFLPYAEGTNPYEGFMKSGTSDEAFSGIENLKLNIKDEGGSRLTATYPDNIIVRISLKKLPIALHLDARQADNLITGTEKEIAKAREDLDKLIQNKHKHYERDLKLNKVPDISKFKFIVPLYELDQLTRYSYQQYNNDLEEAEDAEEDAKEEAEEAASQAAVEDQQAKDEYAKRAEELNSDAVKNGTKYLAAVERFMKPDQNSITRAFNSTGGQGLAGFIETMSFDWMAGTWDTNEGRLAPKMCKINISFSPTHDIPPGLDADGSNRAVIYPTGDDYHSNT
jgi:hypothetical protein